MECTKCKRDLGGLGQREAFIACEVMGDEYIYSYWHCDECNVYSVEVYHDHFSGEDSIMTQGPIEAKVGAESIKLIRTCKKPSNKRCDCPAHKKFAR